MDEVTGLQKAADFGARMIPLVLSIRKARDAGTGLALSHSQVVTLIEVLDVLRSGPTTK